MLDERPIIRIANVDLLAEEGSRKRGQSSAWHQEWALSMDRCGVAGFRFS